MSEPSPSGRLASAETTDIDPAAPPHVSLRLLLPRDMSSIPVVRHLCEYALRELGAAEECTADIGLAITEACANVVQHAGAGESYAVQVSIEGDVCEMRVIDAGPTALDRAGAAESTRTRNLDALSESGRGIAIIEALMDDLSFEMQPETGTLVRMVKRLDFDESSPARKILLGVS
ncbi:MAG: hypothetical protein NVS3B21_29390 [Acidimicrobiales bacterium]